MAMHRALKNLRSTKSAGTLERIAAVPGTKEEAYWRGYQRGVKEAIETMQKEIKLIQDKEIEELLGKEVKGDGPENTGTE